MIKRNPNPIHKNSQKAQGMVEFALALPLFLLLLLGVIECGRLLMTFIAVFSAARETARYGAAVGTTDTGIQFDHDCVGMREAATRVGYLGGVQANQVQITLLNSDGSIKDANWCTEDNSYKESKLSDIIEVKVDGRFWSILPLVNIPNLPVSSTSSRTIVQNVEVYGTPQPTRMITENPAALVLTLDINPPGSGSITKSPDKATYQQNDVVTLTPNPASSWSFANWSHDLSGNLVPITILMTSNKLVTANFTQAHYTLTMNVDPPGAGAISANPIAADYLTGDVVAVSAEPAPGYIFIGWGGDLSGNSPTANLTMNANKSVTAIFSQLAYTLTVTTTGHGTVTRDQPGPYHYGDQVVLTAHAEPDWNFSAWSGDLASGTNPITIVMDSDKTLSATFEAGTYTLSTQVVEGGKIVKSPDRAAYLPGTLVTLTAVADPGWVFSFWTAGVNNPGLNPNQILMDRDKAVGASFIPAKYDLTVNIIPREGGSVSRSLNSPYSYGEKVELTAHPAQGWQFSGWSDGINGATNPSSITMDANKIVNAIFTPIEYTLVISITGQGTVTVVPLQPTYHYGDVVHLTANPGLDYPFTRWGGDLSGSTNPTTITMDNNKAVAATFTRNCVSPTLISLTLIGGTGSTDVSFKITNNSDLDIELLSMVVRWEKPGFDGSMENIFIGNNPDPIWSWNIVTKSNFQPYLVNQWAPGISRAIPKGASTTIHIQFDHKVDSADISPITYSNMCSGY